MRRIYQSDALRRDGDPHTPAHRDRERRTARSRSPWAVDWSRISRALAPTWLGDRAVAVAIETDREVYERDQPVGIRVRMRNRLPLPVAIRTPTRRRWDWTVGGVRRAEGEGHEDAPAEASLLSFHRGETKTFTRTWYQCFRASRDRWTPAEPGTYEVAAFVDVEEPAGRGLRAATEVEIRG